jgi:hypothetical protein
MYDVNSKASQLVRSTSLLTLENYPTGKPPEGISYRHNAENISAENGVVVLDQGFEFEGGGGGDGGVGGGITGDFENRGDAPVLQNEQPQKHAHPVPHQSSKSTQNALM